MLQSQDEALDTAPAEGLPRHVVGRGRSSPVARPTRGPGHPMGFLAAIHPGGSPRGAASVPAGGVQGVAGQSEVREGIRGPECGSGPGTRRPLDPRILDPRHPGDDYQPVDSGRASGGRRWATARGRSATRCGALGHESELFAMTIDDDLRDEVTTRSRIRRRVAATSRSFISRCRRPMTEAFAGCRASRSCSITTSRRHDSSRRTIRRCSVSPRLAAASSARSSAGWISRWACPSSIGRSSRPWASREPASCRSPWTPTD